MREVRRGKSKRYKALEPAVELMVKANTLPDIKWFSVEEQE